MSRLHHEWKDGLTIEFSQGIIFLLLDIGDCICFSLSNRTAWLEEAYLPAPTEWFRHRFL